MCSITFKKTLFHRLKKMKKKNNERSVNKLVLEEVKTI